MRQFYIFLKELSKNSCLEEAAINGDPEVMRLNDTIDVMDMMSEIRTKWQMYYPSETPGEICR